MKKFFPLFAIIIFVSCSNDWDSNIFTGKLVLTNFTYTGTHTAYISIREDNGFFNPSDPAGIILPYFTTVTSPGSSNVLVADIDIQSQGFNSDSGLPLWLMIASDEDDSGNLTAGDYILPVYSLTLKNGEELNLDGITLDPLETQPASGGPYSGLGIQFPISDMLPAVVDSEHPVILGINNSANADFTAGPNYRKIVIPNRRLFGDMMIFSVDGAFTDTYYFFLGYDRDGNGLIDIGENASEATRAAVTTNVLIDPAAYSDTQFNLELNGYTFATN